MLSFILSGLFYSICREKGAYCEKIFSTYYFHFMCIIIQ